MKRAWLADYRHTKMWKNYRKTMTAIITDFDDIFHRYFARECFNFYLPLLVIFSHFLQFLAATVKMMLTFQFGLASSFTGIINAALSGHSNEHNQNETLRITGAESSWLGKKNRSKKKVVFGVGVSYDSIWSFSGSIIYIFQPIGSAISALTTGKSHLKTRPS